MNRKLKTLLILCLLLAMCRPVMARDSESLNLETTKAIRIELNKSVLFRLDEPAARVSIANPKIADVTLVTPKQILIVSKKDVGMTNMIVWYDEERIAAYNVEVFVSSHLLASIRQALKKHAPDAQISMSLTTRSLVLDGYVKDQETLKRVIQIAESFVPEVTNVIHVCSTVQAAIEKAIPEKSKANVTVGMTAEGIVLEGTVDSQATLLRVLQIARTFTSNVSNMLKVQGPQQVQIKVMIAEVSRSAMSQIGLNATLSWDRGSFTSGVIGETTSTFGTAFQILVRLGDGEAILSLLKGQSLARTLATPTLVTLNGQEAEFIVGGEIPYVTDEAIVFRDYGIQLKFTPYVTGKETITLKVEPTVSSPDWSFDPPGLKSRHASTVLQLKDGQTFVMAGLLNQELSQITNKIPFLGDIPIIGALFRSKRFLKNETELVIIATPRFVRPLNPGEAPPLPGADTDLDTTDTRFFLLNDWNPTRTEKKGTKTVPALCGPTGFAK